MQAQQVGGNLPNPQVLSTLNTYRQIKEQLFNHFFFQKPLTIGNKIYTESYSTVYNLLNARKLFVRNSIYQEAEITLLNVYRSDLREFAEKMGQKLCLSKRLKCDDFITCLDKQIKNYARFNHLVFRVFMSIEKPGLNDQGINLYFEGLKILKTTIIDKMEEQIYSAVFQCISLYKCARLTEYQPLQTVIKYLGIIGFTQFKFVEVVKVNNHFEYASKNQQEKYWQTKDFIKFIQRLLDHIKKMYKEKMKFMGQSFSDDYFMTVTECMKKQQRAASQFYNEGNTKQTILKIVNDVLIAEKAEEIFVNTLKNEFERMIKQRSIQSLRKNWSILRKAEKTNIFCKELQNYIYNQGQQIIVDNFPKNEKEKPNNFLDFKRSIFTFFGALIKFHESITQLRKEIDQNDLGLHRAQQYGLQRILGSEIKISRYLAYYLDQILKKDTKSCSNNDELVSPTITLLKYLESYDHFIKVHQRLMGLRILYDNFKNQEDQQAIIGMIKNQAGFVAISKLSNMISEFKNSKEWSTEFRLSSQSSFSFDVFLLTSSIWDIHDPKCGKSLVPIQLKDYVEEYEANFLEKMPNRSLSWIFSHGRAIIKFLNNQQQKYILAVNNYQLLLILYLHNNNKKPQKYRDLVVALKIENEPFFKYSVMNLLKFGILAKTNDSTNAQQQSFEIVLNFDLKYKTQKISCIVIPKQTYKTNNLDKQIEADRSIIIDAALVKIMKQKRTALFSELIAQVQRMCKSFKAETGLIKQRIQHCQDRQFFERDPKDKSILIYKP